MNRSGHAAQCFAERYELDPANVLVIYDEVNLPLGKLRLRRAGSPAGLVAVHQQDDLSKVLLQKLLLPLGKRGPHERNYARQARLVYVDSVEEALDNDNRVAAAHRAMKIEKDQGFPESWLESVLGLRPVNGSPGIGN